MTTMKLYTKEALSNKISSPTKSPLQQNTSQYTKIEPHYPLVVWLCCAVSVFVGFSRWCISWPPKGRRTITPSLQ